MATVDVPLYWSGSGTTPRFTTRQRSFSVASGLSNGGGGTAKKAATARKSATARKPKLSALYDFRRSSSLRKKDPSRPKVLLLLH